MNTKSTIIALGLFTMVGGCELDESVIYNSADHDEINLPTEGWDDVKAQWVNHPSNTLQRDAQARARFESGLALVQSWTGQAITTARIIELHRVVTGDDSGLRSEGQQVGKGGINTAYAPGGQVATLMEQLDVSNPALLDRQLMAVHPFNDGNGRVSRLVAYWAQQQA